FPVSFPAHPRTRGTDGSRGRKPTPAGGSSPHAGNGRSHSGPMSVVSGLIPARGERTRPTGRSPPVVRAHPRTRGTDQEARALQAARVGSSPHAGNGQTVSPGVTRQTGLIPARGERTYHFDLKIGRASWRERASQQG